MNNETRKPETIVRETIDDYLDNYLTATTTRERQVCVQETMNFIKGLGPYLRGYAQRYYFQKMNTTK